MISKKSIYKTLLLFHLLAFVALTTAACFGNTSQMAPKQISTVSQSHVETQVVNDAFGQVTIPLHPQRLIVLDDHTYLDPILSLNVKPVGIAYCNYCGEDYRGIPSSLVDGIPNVGTIEQPSLEAILKLKPDLIVASDYQKKSYPQLSIIAPTLGIDYLDVVNFKERLKYFAQIFGRNEHAKQILSQYEEQVQRIQQELGAEIATKTVSVIHFFNSQSFYVIKPGDLDHSQILVDIGFQFVQAQRSQKEYSLMCSLEVLPNYNADYLFIVTNSSSLNNELTESSILDAPIWSTMKAFQKKQVYFVNWDIGGPIGANRIIDDLWKYLVNSS